VACAAAGGYWRAAPGAGPEAAALRAGEDAYIEKVDRLTTRLRARQVGPGDLEGALAAARDVATVDVDVPTRRNRWGIFTLKTAIKKATTWYLAYLAEQVNDLAFALLRLGEVLAERSRRSEETSADIVLRLEHHEQRLQALETPRAVRPENPGNHPGPV